jgi:ribonuclease HI
MTAPDGLSSRNLEIWADGSGTLSEGPACIGVALFEDGRLAEECGEYIGPGTNNVAELRAIRRGIRLASLRWGVERPIVIFTDSGYAIDALSRLHTPQKNGPLILAVREQLRVFQSWRFQHIHGHEGTFGNELADWLAGEARAAHFAEQGVEKKRRPRPDGAAAAETEGSANVKVERLRAPAPRKVRKPWGPTIRTRTV